MKIERPYSFTDPGGITYDFGFYSRIHMNEHLVLTKIIYANANYTIGNSIRGFRFFPSKEISEGTINDSKMWKIKCEGASEDFRLYLQKCIKLPAFF